jgi:hypothetical protein
MPVLNPTQKFSSHLSENTASSVKISWLKFFTEAAYFDNPETQFSKCRV